MDALGELAQFVDRKADLGARCLERRHSLLGRVTHPVGGEPQPHGRAVRRCRAPSWRLCSRRRRSVSDALTSRTRDASSRSANRLRSDTSAASDSVDNAATAM